MLTKRWHRVHIIFRVVANLLQVRIMNPYHLLVNLVSLRVRIAQTAHLYIVTYQKITTPFPSLYSTDMELNLYPSAVKIYQTASLKLPQRILELLKVLKTLLPAFLTISTNQWLVASTFKFSLLFSGENTAFETSATVFFIHNVFQTSAKGTYSQKLPQLLAIHLTNAALLFTLDIKLITCSNADTGAASVFSNWSNAPSHIHADIGVWDMSLLY